MTDAGDVDKHVARAAELGADWGARDAEDRARALEAVADELANRRGEFISVAAYEANKTVTQTDPEISEAIDFCTYYASPRACWRTTPPSSPRTA